MKSHFTACLMACLIGFAAATSSRADGGAELVEATTIWSQPQRITSTDVVRFKDRWICVFETEKAASANHDLRVIASADGVKWESVAHIKAPPPNRGLFGPKFAVAPDKQLLLAAVGASGQTTRQPMLWDSTDGREWSKTKHLGETNFVLSDMTRHQEMVYSYGYGCICGIAQTVQIRGSKDGRHFGEHFEHTFSGFFPKSAALAFSGARGVCLLSRSNGPNSDRSTLIGHSQSPYTDWDWKQFDLQMSHPNLICLPDGRIVAAVGLHEPRVRTSLCVLDKATSELDEVLKLPVYSRAIDVGLAAHDGYLWVSYHTPDRGEFHIHLAKTKLKTGK